MCCKWYGAKRNLPQHGAVVKSHYATQIYTVATVTGTSFQDMLVKLCNQYQAVVENANALLEAIKSSGSNK